MPHLTLNRFPRIVFCAVALAIALHVALPIICVASASKASPSAASSTAHGLLSITPSGPVVAIATSSSSHFENDADSTNPLPEPDPSTAIESIKRDRDVIGTESDDSPDEQPCGLIGDIEKWKTVVQILQSIGDKVIPVLTESSAISSE